MKLRIHGNSVRLRLRKSEIAAFGESGKLAESLQIGAGHLGYELAAAEVASVEAEFVNGVIHIRIPRDLVAQWCQTEEVGIYQKTPTVEVILEKEFRRTSMASPYDADLYPNPRAAKRE